MKFYKICKVYFAKSVVIPNSLKRKNPMIKKAKTPTEPTNPENPDQKPRKKNLSPLFNLFTTSKLVESKQEIANYHEKSASSTLLRENSKAMFLNYFNISEPENKDQLLENLYKHLTKFYDSQEINKFLGIIQETKGIINSDDIEKTEEIFKIFIHKLFDMTEKKK